MWIQKWGEFFAPLDQVIKNDYINISFIFAFIYSHIRYTYYWWTKQPYYVKMIYGCIFLKILIQCSIICIFFLYILAFKGNFTNKPIAIIELYQIMCHILGLKPNAHNGTWSNVAEMMIKDGTSAGKKNGISTLFILTTIFATMFTLSLTNAAWIVLCVFFCMNVSFFVHVPIYK